MAIAAYAAVLSTVIAVYAACTRIVKFEHKMSAGDFSRLNHETNKVVSREIMLTTITNMSRKSIMVSTPIAEMFFFEGKQYKFKCFLDVFNPKNLDTKFYELASGEDKQYAIELSLLFHAIKSELQEHNISKFESPVIIKDIRLAFVPNKTKYLRHTISVNLKDQSVAIDGNEPYYVKV